MRKLISLFLALVLTMSMASFAVAEAAPETVTIMFHGSNVTDDTEVLAKLNEYLGEKIGVNVDVIWGTWGDFDEKSTTAITGGDTAIDMYFTCSWSADEYNSFAKKGYWLKLDDLLKEYAPEFCAVLPETLMKGATIEGSDGLGVYAVNGYKDYATQVCWDVNVKLLEELGFKLDDIKGGLDFYTMGDMLAKAKEVKGDSFYPLLVEPMVLERMVNNTIIVTGDSGNTNLLSYYVDPTDVSKPSSYGNVMLNKFATDEYKKFAEKVREYYVAGYIDPSLAVAETSNETRTNKQLTGEYLFGTQSYALGYEFQASQERGFEVAMIPTMPPYVDTTVSQGAMVAISSASAHPEASMKFLNLLNTDPVVMTLLNYGIEGVHYTLEDGLVKFTDKRDDYMPWRNGMGNITLRPATVDEGADYWNKTFIPYYNSAKGVPTLGFIFDPANIEVEMSALSNVAAQYALALDAGAVDPATELPKFLEALEAAGMQKYMDEANAQLEAFLAK
ncbi:MAG: ABC transporter substrate-binding protein [Clostridia bacterium]